MAEPGAVSWQFERKGVVELARALDEDQIMEVAMEAGAEDLADAGERWVLDLCAPRPGGGPRRPGGGRAAAGLGRADPGAHPDRAGRPTRREAKRVLRLLEAHRRPRRRPGGPRQLRHPRRGPRRLRRLSAGHRGRPERGRREPDRRVRRRRVDRTAAGGHPPGHPPGPGAEERWPAHAPRAAVGRDGGRGFSEGAGRVVPVVVVVAAAVLGGLVRAWLLGHTAALQRRGRRGPHGPGHRRRSLLHLLLGPALRRGRALRGHGDRLAVTAGRSAST